MSLRSCAMWLLSAFVAAALTAGHAASQAATVACPVPVAPGQGIDEELFQLREIDMHLHCGLERPIPLEAWIDSAVADGRKVIVGLDHFEGYHRTPEQLAAWRAERDRPPWYGVGAEGRKAFQDDLASLERRKDVVVFRGWEFGEATLDRPPQPDILQGAEVIGFHIGENKGGPAPDGQHLIHRVRQAIALQEQVPIPMILFHPLAMRVANLHRTATAADRDPSTITVAEYRFYTPAQQDTLISLLRGRSIYIEVGRRFVGLWQDPTVRQALIEDIRPLAEAGVQFTVSTDGHGLGGPSFQPNVYCDALGVTPRHTNTIVRELLAARARRAVAAAQEAEVAR